MNIVNFLCFVTVLSSLASSARYPSKEELQHDAAHDPFSLLNPGVPGTLSRHRIMMSRLKKMYRHPDSKKSNGTCILYISFLLVTLSNDVQTHPGPRIPKYPCGSCGKAVRNNQNSIQCEACLTWHHIECQGMNVKIHQIMGDHESYSWSCLNCGLPNFCTSLFENSISFMESSNSFSVLDDSLTPTTSTPAKLSKHFAKKRIPRKLKILNLNLQSIVNKVQEFHCLLDIENPDIVVGTESWLRSDIANSEVFPQATLYSVLIEHPAEEVFYSRPPWSIMH